MCLAYRQKIEKGMKSGCFASQKKDHQSEETDLCKIKPKRDMTLKRQSFIHFCIGKTMLHLNLCFRNKITQGNLFKTVLAIFLNIK